VYIKPFEKRIWLSSPTMHGKEMVYVNEAYDTNWMSTLGSNIDEIEKNISEIIGCKYAVALSSCTSALHMAVKLAGVKPGDKVFCTDMTFSATVNPVLYEGGIPVFIDSEYETWNMDPNALELAFSKYPEVNTVIIVNLYGVPAKLNEIREICDRHNALLIEDAAESFGAKYYGKQTGSFGDYNAISFNGNKIITGSTGGMLLTNSSATADKAKKWSTQSRENAPWYQHKEIGYNYRMSNVVAGVVRGQLEYLDEHIAQKKSIYMRYKEGLKDIAVTMNPYIEECMEPNFWLSCLLIDQDAMCKQSRGDNTAFYTKVRKKTCPTEILEKLAYYNAEGRPIWKPMHMQPIFNTCDFVYINGESVSEDIFSRGLCLPSDIKITEEDQENIIQIVRSCFQ